MLRKRKERSRYDVTGLSRDCPPENQSQKSESELELGKKKEKEEEPIGRIVALQRSPHHERDEDFLLRLRSEDCYRGIDVLAEWAKCGIWCEKNHKQRTQKRFVNWLNRIERPSQPEKKFDLSEWAREAQA